MVTTNYDRKIVTKNNLYNNTVSELKQICEWNGIYINPGSFTKNIIIEKIIEFNEKDTGDIILKEEEICSNKKTCTSYGYNRNNCRSFYNNKLCEKCEIKANLKYNRCKKCNHACLKPEIFCLSCKNKGNICSGCSLPTKDIEKHICDDCSIIKCKYCKINTGNKNISVCDDCKNKYIEQLMNSKYKGYRMQEIGSYIENKYNTKLTIVGCYDDLIKIESIIDEKKTNLCVNCNLYSYEYKNDKLGNNICKTCKIEINKKLWHYSKLELITYIKDKKQQLPDNIYLHFYSNINKFPRCEVCKQVYISSIVLKQMFCSYCKYKIYDEDYKKDLIVDMSKLSLNRKLHQYGIVKLQILYKMKYNDEDSNNCEKQDIIRSLYGKVTQNDFFNLSKYTSLKEIEKENEELIMRYKQCRYDKINQIEEFKFD